MAAMTFRTDKLLKELERLYDRRMEAEADCLRLERNADYTGAQFQEGLASGIRRAIYNICSEFDLMDTDVAIKNNEIVQTRILDQI